MTRTNGGQQAPAVRFDDASLSYQERMVWSHLSLCRGVERVRGHPRAKRFRQDFATARHPGSGELDRGNRPGPGCSPHRGNQAIGYIPQAQAFDRDLPLRGRDLVRLGLDGSRWGVALPNRTAKARVDAAIDAAGASNYADAPIGRLSGGEQQRLRVAQAIVGEPRLLLCDEPLAHLDLRYQQDITELIAHWQQGGDRTVLFVTHDVNPILPIVERVLFVVNGRWAAGTPNEVLTSERLSDLYSSHVDVLRVHDRVIVVGDELSTASSSRSRITSRLSTRTTAASAPACPTDGPDLPASRL